MLKTLLKDKTALFLSLGTKIGVGSIIGTTASIIIGGPSGVIWMFIFSILTSSLIYAESYLGIKYREKTKDGHIGGSYYILKNGLNKKRLAIISLLLLLIIYSFLFQMVQSNTIAHSIELTMNINKNIIFVIFIIILSITLSLNIKELLNTMNKIVPFMCILFIIIALLAITKNIKILLPSLKLLFSNITSLKSFFAGAIIGIKRSIFMNETLIGTTSLSASIDRNDKKTAINIQVLGTYIITFIIGLLITLMISIYLYKYDITSNYLELIINVFNSLIGNIGVYILIIIFILFGTTTILSGYYIGKSNLEHLTNKKLILHIFKLLFITFTLGGIFINTSLLWKIIDSFMYIMIIINIYSIIRLGDKSDWK
ncbi:MAG: sodium:alanine symporter family protein [Bacilli bacterium]|nr:sodium:alanine symporter family protein [Bacilli bacterium]